FTFTSGPPRVVWGCSPKLLEFCLAFPCKLKTPNECRLVRLDVATPSKYGNAQLPSYVGPKNPGVHSWAVSLGREVYYPSLITNAPQVLTHAGKCFSCEKTRGGYKGNNSRGICRVGLERFPYCPTPEIPRKSVKVGLISSH